MNYFLNLRKVRVCSALLLILCIGVFSAEAHSVTDVGDYSIIVGWEIEPPIVGERNVMYVDLLKDGQLVAARESSLNLQLIYGDTAKTVIPTQNPETGRYRVTFIPTVAGDYSFQVTGTAGEQVIDVVVTPEPVESPIALQFPEISLTNIELQTIIESSEAANAVARQQVRIALGLGVASILLSLGVGAFVMRRT